ncbi:hypothetical protein BDV06DRAFT_12328 [Aspergillus oleicola]
MGSSYFTYSLPYSLIFLFILRSFHPPGLHVQEGAKRDVEVFSCLSFFLTTWLGIVPST